jgi:hypothetical protein
VGSRSYTEKAIAEDLEKGVKVVINAIREGINVEGVHGIIITSLTILQGKCSICTTERKDQFSENMQHMQNIISS